MTAELSDSPPKASVFNECTYTFPYSPSHIARRGERRSPSRYLWNILMYDDDTSLRMTLASLWLCGSSNQGEKKRRSKE